MARSIEQRESGRETAKEKHREHEAQAETGTPRDVKGVPHVDGRHDHMRGPNHEFGQCHDGTHYHDHHRGKKD